MLRPIRIVGILVFAVLAAFSGHALKSMLETGEFFEPYNSRRKAHVTLFSVSLLALGTLGYLEARRPGGAGRTDGYRGKHYRKATAAAPPSRDASNIYAAPRTVDPWDGRRMRSFKPRKPARLETGNLWPLFAKSVCGVQMVLYGTWLALRLVRNPPSSPAGWMLPAFLAAMLAVSAATFAGIVRKRLWGMALGYLLAIANLLFFPVGTVIGLLLLVGLVGIAPLFQDARRGRGRPAQRTKSARNQSLAV